MNNTIKEVYQKGKQVFCVPFLQYFGASEGLKLETCNFFRHTNFDMFLNT